MLINPLSIYNEILDTQALDDLLNLRETDVTKDSEIAFFREKVGAAWSTIKHFILFDQPIKGD